MKATELRIGNLVAFNHKWDIISEVEEIQQHSVRFLFDTKPYGMNALITHPENLIPIPLTEELLLKFGFEKVGKTIFLIGNFKITLKDNVFSFYTYHYQINLKSIHQLQNLYFALTGEELTI